MAWFEHYAIKQILLTTSLAFLLLGCVAALIVGIALCVRSTATFRFFGVMSRWHSARTATKPLEMPHNLEPPLHRHRRLIGVVFIVSAVFSFAVLWQGFEVTAIVALLGGRFNVHAIEAAVASIKWGLLIANAVAVLIGIILIGYPRLLTRMEIQMNHWYSSRLAMKGLDTMHFSLDRWVEANPRVSGVAVIALALFAALNLGLVLLGTQ